MSSYSQQIFDLNNKIEESIISLDKLLLSFGQKAVDLNYCPDNSKSNTIYTQIRLIEKDIFNLEENKSTIRIIKEKYSNLINEKDKVKKDIKEVEIKIYENNQNTGRIAYDLYLADKLDKLLFYNEIDELNSLIEKKKEQDDKSTKGGLSNMVHSFVRKRRLITIENSILEHFANWGSLVISQNISIAVLEKNYELFSLYLNELEVFKNRLNTLEKEITILESDNPFLLKDIEIEYSKIDAEKNKLNKKLEQSYISFGRALSSILCDIYDQSLKDLYSKVLQGINDLKKLKSEKSKYEFLEKKGDALVTLNKKQEHLNYLLNEQKKIERQISDLKKEIKDINNFYFNDDYSE